MMLLIKDMIHVRSVAHKNIKIINIKNIENVHDYFEMKALTQKCGRAMIIV